MTSQSPGGRIDRIIAKLLQGGSLKRDTTIKLEVTTLKWLCSESIKVLSQDPILLHLEAPVTIIGDIHGQFYDLLSHFKACGSPGQTQYLCLGDYVDRGRNSVETITLLLAMKVKYPTSFFLLRGNHETSDISRLYGFYDECASLYTSDVWMRFCEVFDYLPVAAIVSNRIFCVHGGLSPNLRSLEQIENLRRPLRIPDSGFLTDLLWSDPSNEHSGYKDNERGISYSFGADVVQKFIDANDFDLVCRAHQVVNQGFDFPFSPAKTLLTIFSAPDYCEEFNNRGAVLVVDRALGCKFHTIDPPRRRSYQVRGRLQTPAYRYR